MKPTYLYIKQHSVTGLLYFGKTTQNPETYIGSGVRWRAHLKKHGKEHVVTLWYCLFLTPEDISSTADYVSLYNNITESDNWANLKPENGLDGGSYVGRQLSAETKQKMSNVRRGVAKSETAKQNMRNGNTGKAPKPWLIEYNKQRAAAGWVSPCTNRPQPTTICPHCGKEGSVSNLKRWHFDNCKILTEGS